MAAKNIQRTAYGVVDLAAAVAADQFNIFIAADAAGIYARQGRIIG